MTANFTELHPTAIAVVLAKAYSEVSSSILLKLLLELPKCKNLISLTLEIVKLQYNTNILEPLLGQGGPRLRKLKLSRVHINSSFL